MARTARKRLLWGTLLVTGLMLGAARLTLGILVTQPIGAVPEGVTMISGGSDSICRSSSPLMVWHLRPQEA